MLISTEMVTAVGSLAIAVGTLVSNAYSTNKGVGALDEMRKRLEDCERQCESCHETEKHLRDSMETLREDNLSLMRRFIVLHNKFDDRPR